MIKERLLVLPNKIEEMKIRLLGKQQELEDTKTDMKIWELTEINEISNELDDKGKAVYSNDTKRQAELQSRKNDSRAYEELYVKSRTLEDEISHITFK